MMNDLEQGEIVEDEADAASTSEVDDDRWVYIAVTTHPSHTWFLRRFPAVAIPTLRLTLSLQGGEAAVGLRPGVVVLRQPAGCALALQLRAAGGVVAGGQAPAATAAAAEGAGEERDRERRAWRQ